MRFEQGLFLNFAYAINPRPKENKEDLKAIEFIQSTIGEKPIYNSNSTADPQRVAEVQEIINELIGS